MVKDRKSSKSDETGKLRIGDQWNAINIIALSQSNPLKAVAEFVENSIDAEARNVTITRGKERGKSSPPGATAPVSVSTATGSLTFAMWQPISATWSNAG